MGLVGTQMKWAVPSRFQIVAADRNVSLGDLEESTYYVDEYDGSQNSGQFALVRAMIAA
jgi:hypothetical protein